MARARASAICSVERGRLARTEEFANFFDLDLLYLSSSSSSLVNQAHGAPRTREIFPGFP
jgi:hypothetical protein